MADGSDETVMLVTLPDDEFSVFAQIMLVADLPSMLRLRQVSRLLLQRLKTTHTQAQARRLRWLSECSTDCQVSHWDRTVARVADADDSTIKAVGTLLPRNGRSAFSVRVATSFRRLGLIEIGVCDRPMTYSWILDLHNGMLFCWSRGGDGALDTYCGRPRRRAPDRYPCAHLKWVMKDASGTLCSLWEKAEGAVVEVILDHDVGTLAFVVNDTRYEALSGFPEGAELRPYVRLWGSAGDSVELLTRYV